MLTFAFVFGLVVGSFLNVLIYRLPRSFSIVWPSSRCVQCSHPIRPYDNIPLVSFLVLRGKCRDCSAKISVRYPAVELLGGLSALVAAWRWGFSAYGIMAFVIMAASIVITFVDYEHQIIPDEISISGIAVGLVFSFFFPVWHEVFTPLGSLKSAVIGLVAGGGFLYLAGTIGEWVFKKEAMGGGDVKLMAAIGAFFGWKGVALTIFIGSFFGAAVGIFLRVLKGQERIPFGRLVAGMLAYLFYGHEIISWYSTRILGY